jgi:Protein of unknown function (DUF2783)
MRIRLDPNLGNPDTFYARLIAVNEKASEEQVLEFFMKLSLILANQIGDASVVQACVEEAAKNDAEQQGNDHG